MADLRLNDADLVAALSRRAEAYKRDFDSMVASVLDGISVAARAAAALPAQAESLLRTAEVAFVKEIDNPQKGEVSADIRIGSPIWQLGVDYHRQEVAPGKYRVLLFLIPLKGNVALPGVESAKGGSRW